VPAAEYQEQRSLWFFQLPDGGRQLRIHDADECMPADHSLLQFVDVGVPGLSMEFGRRCVQRPRNPKSNFTLDARRQSGRQHCEAAWGRTPAIPQSIPFEPHFDNRQHPIPMTLRVPYGDAAASASEPVLSPLR